jgi:hypothetical protein
MLQKKYAALCEEGEWRAERGVRRQASGVGREEGVRCEE